jgi:DNA-binding beta-propeller fold protein YncE
MGAEPGKFGWVTDAAEDSRGNLYVAEYGHWDRVQKFSPNGEFLMQWGGHGSEPGQFRRPQAIAIDERDQVWVADACNHRIQVFDATGSQAVLVKSWGELGDEPGKMRYPYSLALDGRGHVYVCEYGNHRVQKFTEDGKSLGAWGKPGRGEGELWSPWAVAVDPRGRAYVLDSGNHRVQRICW